MKILATSDWHIRSDRLDDQREVFGRIAGLAMERDVELILHGGDVFHGPILDPAHEEVFADFIAWGWNAGIEIVCCLGNSVHDLASRERHALTVFKHVPGITIADAPAVHYLTGHPKSVAVACLPWTPVGPLVARHGGGDRDHIHEVAAEYLIEIARGLRADISQDVPAILLLHWSISGASLPNGLAVDEHAREPILPLAALADLHFDAVIAGHIHKPQIRHPDNPFVAYCGSPLPLNFGEADTQHGVWILDIDTDGVRPEFVEIPSRPFVTLDYDLTRREVGEEGATGSPTPSAAGTATPADLPDVTGAYVRVRYTATEEQNRSIDRSMLERALYDAGAHKVVSITPDIVRVERARADAAIEDLSPVETVRAWVTAQEFERAEEIVAAAGPYLEEA